MMIAGFFNLKQNKLMTTIKINKTLFIVAAAVFIIACNANNTATVNNKNHTDSNMVSVYTFQVEHGYGYAVFVNDKEFIHQDCIPVIQGNKPFTSKEQAKETGELVAQKIRSKQLPTLTLEELNKIGITQ